MRLPQSVFCGIVFLSLRVRLMVGHMPLEHGIGVRVPDPQPSFRIRFFAKLRIKKGISQDRLSKDADLALNTVVKIETGESPNPTVDTLEKLAKALGVSTAELFK